MEEPEFYFEETDPLSDVEPFPKNHMKSSKLPHRCLKCTEEFETTDLRIEHVRIIHPETKIRSCSHCEKECLTSGGLRDHHRKKHPGMPLDVKKEKKPLKVA